jgi:acetyl-CoA carboxylase biotin carboxyl carrier protein
MMNIKDLKEYIEFMKEHELSELEIQDGDKKIRLKKDVDHAIATMPAPIVMPQGAIQQIPLTKAAAAEGTIEIKSPMVGTFYRSPSPGAKSYVETGTTIKPGDVLCIVEAMKLMNEIKAEVSGKIVQINTENGDPVEFGQVLFTIEPV